MHSHLFRRMYHAGIQDKTWTIIKSLHHNAESCIKWAGNTSDCFKVGMGDRQGGILSTDLYKLYINPLLDRLQDVGIGLNRNRCECITLSNAAFASRSTRCPFCFSSVNIMYASSTGRAAFMGTILS
jgi:hypothetical protein